MSVLRPNSFNQWREFIFNQHPKGMDLTLDRVKAVAEAMGLTQLSATVVIVAGTNGKGSVVNGLSAFYAKSAHRVGAFISPHIQSLTERILIDHNTVDTSHWVAACQAIWPYTQTQPLTFFEWLLLIALWIFKDNGCDLVILEVGLGGRLDATNVLDADLAIITKIAFDHQKFLGDSLDAISYEKAGVCRPHQSVILGEQTRFPALLAHLKLLEANIIPAPENHQIIGHLHPQAIGCIEQAVHWLAQRGFEGDEVALQQHCQNFQPVGRLSPLPAPWLGWLDVAHNPDAVTRLAEFLETRSEPIGCLWFSYADKPVDEMVYLLRQHFVCWHVVDLPCPRGDVSALTSALSRHNIVPAAVHSDMAQAYAALRQDKTVKTWVIWGGFEVVGEWLNYHDSLS